MQMLPEVPQALPLARAGAQRGEMREFVRFSNVLLRRYKLFLGIFFGFLAAVTIVTLATPRMYTTTARLIPGTHGNSEAANSDTSLPILNALVMQSGEQTAETLAALAQQQNTASATAQRLGLRVSPTDLLTYISVKPLVNTPILELSARWKTPEGSARLANGFAQAFIDSERDFVRSQARAAIGFLSSEIPGAQARMHDSATQLASFQSANGFVDAGSHTQDVVAHAAALESQADALQIDRREASALLANVRAQLSQTAQSIDNSKQISVNPVISDLRARLTSTETQLAAAEQQYTDAHPAVVALRKQRDELRSQIASQPAQLDSSDTYAPNPIYQTLAQQAAQYEARIDGDGAKLQELQRERTALAPVLKRLPSQGVQLAALQQRAKMAADVYNALLQKYNDAVIANTTAISDITLVQPATAAAAIKSPNIKVNLAVGAAIGLLLAALIVFVLDYFERTLQDSNDVGSVMGLPVIATIPAFTTANPRQLPWLQSLTVEAFLHLCVWLRLSKHRPLRTLAVTSPSQGDGKSTVAFNLAKAMAKVEQRILLIDGDMRKPTLHELAQKNNVFGLSDVLAGRMRLEDAVREIAPQLDLLTSGRDIGDPIGLIESPIFDDLLKTAERSYAMVIIDTLPATFIPEAISLCSKVDGVLLVVSANTTEERAARRLAVQLETLGLNNILGVVLNRDRARFHDYSDYFASSFRPALPETK